MSVRLNVVMEIPGKEAREFEYEFDQEKISLGRDQNNDIQIPLSTVSRNHAIIYLEGGEWYIEDLKSTHGTLHNGRQVGAGGKKLLRNGDVIEVVHFKITFSQGEVLSEEYSTERTEALAQRMVQEVLASIGTDGDTPYLRVMNGPDEGTKFELGPNVSEVVIGRGTDCDFQINDANISRRHAVVRRDWNDITIEDLGSKNGVVINDKKINGRASLRDADEILLGAVRLTFIDPSAKFIGKLDDIPAFQDNTRQEEEAVSEEPEEEPPSDPPSVAAPQDPTGRHAPAPADDPPPSIEGPPAEGGDDEPPAEGADGLEDAADDDELPEGTDVGVKVKKGLGVFEYSLIGLAVVVVVGLGVGLALLFL